MKVRLSLFCVSFLLLLAGCSTDNVLTGEMKISRVYGGGNLQGEYSYDAAGLLSVYTSYLFPGRKSSEIVCSYDGNNRLVKKETMYDLSSGPNPLWSYGYTEYNYTSTGRVSEEKNYSKQNGVYILVSKIKPAFDAGGRLISRTMLLPGDTIIRQTTYSYDTRGNIVLQEEYKYYGSTRQLEYSYSYDDYDNKRNPHEGMANSVPPFSVNKNNILQTTVTNYVMIPGSPVTTMNKTIINSYNGNLLPVSVSENGTNFTYEYKQ